MKFFSYFNQEKKYINIWYKIFLRDEKCINIKKYTHICWYIQNFISRTTSLFVGRWQCPEIFIAEKKTRSVATPEGLPSAK